MSHDKHRGVARREFALANAPRVIESGTRRSRMRVMDVLPEPKTGSRRECHERAHGRPIVDITADIRALVKRGTLKRKRSWRDRGHCGRARHTEFVEQIGK